MGVSRIPAIKVADSIPKEVGCASCNAVDALFVDVVVVVVMIVPITISTS